MAKMRKEYDPNKVKQRKRKPVIYVICEGKETEVLYFKHFRTRNCLVDIVPMTSNDCPVNKNPLKRAKSMTVTVILLLICG